MRSIANDSYTESLDVAVVSARDDLDWRNDYMSIYFAMMDAEMEARERGLEQGDAMRLINQVLRKRRKDKTPAEAADELEASLPEIEAIYRAIEAVGPEASAKAIFDQLEK